MDTPRPTDNSDFRPDPVAVLDAWQVDSPLCISFLGLDTAAYLCVGKTVSRAVPGEVQRACRSVEVQRLDKPKSELQHLLEGRIHPRQGRIIEGELSVIDRTIDGSIVRGATADLHWPHRKQSALTLDEREADYLFGLVRDCIIQAKAEIATVRTTDAELVLAGKRLGMGYVCIAESPFSHDILDPTERPYDFSNVSDNLWANTPWGTKAEFNSWRARVCDEIEDKIAAGNAGDIQAAILRANATYGGPHAPNARELWVELSVQ